MPVIAVASARSSVGATQLAVELALAWHRSGAPALLVEADPDGGVLAARLGLAATPNLTELAGRARSGIDPTVLRGCAQPGPHGLPVVVAHAGTEQTMAALRAAGDRLAGGLARSGSHVVVDVGRLRPSSPALPLADAADAALVLVRPQLDELTSLAARLALLPASTATGLVLVGPPGFPPAEVERHLGVPVAAVIDGRSSRRRDPLAEAARRLAQRLQERLAPPPSPSAPAPWPAPVPA